MSAGAALAGSGDTGHPDAPSAWLERWAHLLPGAGATALDVAAGRGRHVRWLQARGLHVTAVDRDAAVVATWPAGVEALQADLERGPWPLEGRRFDLVLVTNYLWRPLLGRIVDAVAAGGVLVYETFARGHEAYGRPANPEFLLRPGELLAAASGLHVIAYEDVTLDAPPRCVQHIVARRSPAVVPGSTVGGPPPPR